MFYNYQCGFVFLSFQIISLGQEPRMKCFSIKSGECFIDLTVHGQLISQKDKAKLPGYPILVSKQSNYLDLLCLQFYCFSPPLIRLLGRKCISM